MHHFPFTTRGIGSALGMSALALAVLAIAPTHVHATPMTRGFLRTRSGRSWYRWSGSGSG
jgi:hypothetical protein